MSGAGSSAQKPAVNQWIDGYQRKCRDAAVTYDGAGSGAGINQFSQGQVPFAGSDAALSPDEQSKADQRCKTGKAIQVPMVATPVQFVFRLSGVDDLTLTPGILAQVYSGEITTWNHPDVVAANPGKSLPPTTITAVHRSSDSGTTDNMTKFLAAQAPDRWKYGSGKAWRAPGGVGGKDSLAVVQQLKNTDGALGYVDGPDAIKNNLRTASVDVGQGPVAATKESVAKALSAAKTTVDGPSVTVAVNYGLHEAGAYPAILVTYEITCSKGLSGDQGALVKSFLNYAASDQGQAALEPIGHQPLPADLINQVRKAVNSLA